MKLVLMGGLALLIAAAGPAAAADDVKYTMEMGTEGGPQAQMPRGMAPPKMRFTVAVKGQQERRDMSMDMGGMGGMNLSYLTNCETNKTVIVNWKCSAYLTTSADAEPGMGMGGRPGAAPKGGVVKVDGEYRDTGERKQMLGREARHVFMKMKMTPSAGACMPAGHEQEMEMWMVNVDAAPRCREAYKPQQYEGGCQDRFEVSFRGQGAARGLPVYTRMSFQTPQGKVSTTMTVTELNVGPVDAAQFQIPANFREVQSMQDLYMCGMGMPSGAGGTPDVAAAMARAAEARRQAQEAAAGETARARSGVILIGVYMTGSAGDLPAAGIAQAVAEAISNVDGFEGVLLNAIEEAVEKKCQFVLTAEVSETRQSTGARIGGILGRATGATGAGRHNVKMDYRLATLEGEEAGREALNHTYSDSDGPDSMFQRTAERATRDARRFLRK
jgi:hypothetical protein